MFIFPKFKCKYLGSDTEDVWCTNQMNVKCNLYGGCAKELCPKHSAKFFSGYKPNGSL